MSITYCQGFFFSQLHGPHSGDEGARMHCFSVVMGPKTDFLKEI